MVSVCSNAVPNYGARGPVVLSQTATVDTRPCTQLPDEAVLLVHHIYEERAPLVACQCGGGVLV